MSKFDASQIQWREPWHAITPDYAAKAEAEIHREMCAGHVLFGRSVTAVGYRQDCDDVLFELLDGSGRLAVVHLTFAQHPEPNAAWPSTEIFADWSAFERERMQPDAEEWAE